MTRRWELRRRRRGRALLDGEYVLIGIGLLDRLLRNNRVRAGQMIKNRVVVPTKIGPSKACPNHAFLCQLVGDPQPGRKIVVIYTNVGTVEDIPRPAQRKTPGAKTQFHI